MAKSRKTAGPEPGSTPGRSSSRRLKVFRTAIGFHDAYVAAPSQKAALEAWGADSNLFAQGIAEQVTERELIKAPLERPGEVVKVLRGNAEQQVAALGQPLRGRRDVPANDDRAAAKSNGKEGGPRIKSGVTKKKKPLPRPSRAALGKAERAVWEAEERHRRTLEELREEEEALRERRRKLEGEQARERDRLRATAERAERDYRAAVSEWAGIK